jgi:SAM-dependent methyltransferase
MGEHGGGAVDARNRATWSRPEVVRVFGRIEGWGGAAGEHAVLARIRELVGQEPILDLGVGAGRTVPAMLAISDQYLGLDYTLAMVAAARSRFPGVRIEHGDARDLRGIEDSSFGFVFFSYNGLDAVTHDDRARVLREVRRVLRPGGVFGYSTHNLESAVSGLRPWSGRLWPRHPVQMARTAVHFPAACVGYRRSSRLVQRGDGWAMLVSPSHRFGIVCHHVSLEAARHELREAGFADETEMYDRDGVMIDVSTDIRATPWFHVVARAPSPDREATRPRLSPQAPSHAAGS